MGDDPVSPVSRRRFLAGAGAGVGGVLALAGCTTNPNLGEGGTGGDGGGDGSGGTTQQHLSGSISITGSSTVYPLSRAVAEAFREQHGDVQIDISPTGSGGGFSNYFCKGTSAFNNASRTITDSETQQCAANGITPIELAVATDAITVIVHPDADWVDCVTVKELRQIWEPNGADRWNDVRDEWPDRPLELFGAASTSGTFDYFTEVIVGEEGSSRQDYTATEQDNSIVAGVTGSTHAMGYLGFSYYDSNRDRVKALGVENPDTGECVEPTLETAKSGAYRPLSRPLFTYPAKEALAEPHVAAFARYFVEQSGNESLVADRVGYVPNTDEVVQAQLDRLETAISEAQG